MKGSAFIAEFVGDCDISRYPDLHALLEGIPEDAPAILIDLSRVTLIDSTALSELLLWKHRLDQGNRTVAVLAPDPNVYRVMALANVVEKLNVFSDRANALEFLRDAIGT